VSEESFVVRGKDGRTFLVTAGLAPEYILWTDSWFSRIPPIRRRNRSWWVTVEDDSSTFRVLRERFTSEQNALDRAKELRRMLDAGTRFRRSIAWRRVPGPDDRWFA
jgi:hypothetical protein